MKLIIALFLTSSFTAFAQKSSNDPMQFNPFKNDYYDPKSDSIKPLWNVDLKSGDVKVITDVPQLKIQDDPKTGNTTYIHDGDSFLVKQKTPEGHRVVTFKSSSGIVNKISSVSFNEKGLTDYLDCDEREDCTIISPKVCHALLPVNEELLALTKKTAEIKQCISLFEGVGKVYEKFNEVQWEELERIDGESRPLKKAVEGAQKIGGKMLYLGAPLPKTKKTPNNSLFESLVQMEPVAYLCQHFIDNGHFGKNYEVPNLEAGGAKKESSTKQ